MIFNDFFSLSQDLEHILYFLPKHLLFGWILFFEFLTDLCAVYQGIRPITKSYEDFLFQLDWLCFLAMEKLQALRCMVMLQFCLVDNPKVLPKLHLPYGDPRFALRLTEEMVTFSVLVWAKITWSSTMTLTNKTFANFFILICFMPAFCVSYSGESVELL